MRTSTQVLLVSSMLVLPTLAVLSQADAGKVRTPPNNPDIPASAPAQPLPGPPEATDVERDPSTKARQVTLQHKKQRRARGDLPISEQVSLLADENDMSDQRVRDTGGVVVTFATPMPLGEYNMRVGNSTQNSLLKQAARVTLYIELDDGYPVMVSGPPGSPLAENARAFLRDEASSRRERASMKTGRDSSSDARDRRFATLAQRALDEFDQLAVILGMSMPLHTYADLQQEFHSNFDVASAEVIVSPGTTPFKAPDAPIDSEAVAAFQEHYD